MVQGGEYGDEEDGGEGHYDEEDDEAQYVWCKHNSEISEQLTVKSDAFTF